MSGARAENETKDWWKMAGLKETAQLPESKLECPICWDDLISPIFQCFNGHLLCGTCIDAVAVCPICRDVLPEKKIKALAVENLLRDCKRPCPFSEHGCQKILASSDGDHPFQCQYARIAWLQYARFKSLPSEKKEDEVDSGRGRSEGSFSFTVDNISETLQGTQIWRSPVMYVRNLPWKIKLEPHYQAGKRSFLGISLLCVEERSINWSCNAEVRFRILSHIIRNGTANHHTKRFDKRQQFRSSSGYRCFGYKEFLDWGTLRDPYKGFEKNGSVTVEVHIKADAPRWGPDRI